MSLFAGIDCGTQSTKVVVYDTCLRSIVAQASHAYSLIAKDDGSREQEASWFWEAVLSCFGQIDPSVKKKIKGIGVSGQQHGFVPLDKDGNAIAPVKLWCDTSTEAECAMLTRALGGDEACVGLVGNTLKSGFTIGKVYAMKLHNPGLWKKLSHILLPHDWLNFRLTGRMVMEAGDASGTAMLDIVHRRWNETVLAAIDPYAPWETLLPPLVENKEPIGTVMPEVARMLGLGESVIVSCGGGDNMMAAIGTGCVQEGAMTVSMGTSGTLFAYSSQPVVDASGVLSGFCSSSGGYLPLMCTMNCTVATEKVRSLLGISLEEMNCLAASSTLGSSGVVLLPYFNGERTPDYPHGRGVFAGFNADNCTRENLCRAAMESAVFALVDGMDVFASKKMVPHRILLAGGGARSAFWRQMVSDVFALPVSVSTIAESAAFGGALQALWASGEEGTDLVEICKRHLCLEKEKECEPNGVAHARYLGALSSWRTYQKTMAPLFR